MQLFLTVDNEDILRIEEDGGAAITISYSDGVGQILSILVPKDDRREGVGSTLLSCAESMLLKKGVKKLEADFMDSIPELGDFFESAGYEVLKGAPVKAVDMRALLASLTVKRAINNDIDDSKFVPLSELFVMQWDELLELLNKFNIKLGNSDMARFSQELSGVVYDNEDQPQAFVLCSKNDEGVHVELLAGVSNGRAKYVISALLGMIKAIVDDGGFKTYPKLSMIAANENINVLISRVLKKGKEAEEKGHLIYAFKDLKEDNLLSYDYDLEKSEDEDMEEEWRREVKKIPLQSNICWKMPWYRMFGGDNSEASGKSASKTKSGKHVSDVEINFDKDEEILEGLMMDDTVRITMDNLEDYSDILPPDIYHDMPRPFYRGLAAVDAGETKAAMVWEYKNVEEDVDTESMILWYFCSDEAMGDELIQEYTNEIKQEDVQRSYFEFKELSDMERSVLEKNGFSIKNEESEEVEVHMENVVKAPFAAKKAAPYVKALDVLSEKQFKRGVTNCLFHNRKGVLEDMAFLPMSWYDQNLSCCVIGDNKVIGLCLFHRSPSGVIHADLLFSMGSEYQLDILNMIRYAVHAGVAKYPKNTPVIIRRHNAEIHGLVSKLFPDLSGDIVVHGERRVG